jgi:hypothetical protein
MTDCTSFSEEMIRKMNQHKHINELVARYQVDMPTISAMWDLSKDAVSFNDISEKILADGVSIYSCEMDSLWRGLFDPRIYDANTIWGRNHSKHKIAKVIEAWENAMSLSPLFLVKHGTKDLGLVSDGKHRLTVSRAIGALQVPFMVGSADKGWVEKAFPGAILISHEVHGP